MVRYAILGPVELCDGELHTAVGGPRQVALLALFLVNANRALSSDSLIDALWSDLRPAGATKRLQVAIGRLRRTLDGDGARGESVLQTTTVELLAHHFAEAAPAGQAGKAADYALAASASAMARLATRRRSATASEASRPSSSREPTMTAGAASCCSRWPSRARAPARSTACGGSASRRRSSPRGSATTSGSRGLRWATAVRCSSASARRRRSPPSTCCSAPWPG